MPATRQPFPNEFRRRLLAGERLIGCWASLASAISTEVLGYAGFDWLLLDGEHAPNDVSTIMTQLMALKDSPSAPVVRPPWAEPVIIKRLLDVGAYNFLMPFVQTADDARQAVACTRYPPQGIRGVAMSHRSNHYGYARDYFSQVNDNVSVLVQIESPTAVREAAAIAAVDGVDGLFVGPSDLSAGLGHFGNVQHPEVQQAIAQVLEAGRAHGKAVGILSGTDADSQRYLDMGLSCLAVGVDVVLLRNASRQLRARFAEGPTES